MDVKNDKLISIYEILSKEYPTFNKSGPEWDNFKDFNSSDFKSLITVMLSTMTNSKRLIMACKSLFSKVETPNDILKLSNEELALLIKPVAHYNKKAIHLKEMCIQLLSNYHGQVPKTKEELLKLKGVGLKCANVIMNFNFGANTIAVDTHVHRVLNRLKIVDTKTPKQTSLEINEITPNKFKKHAHEWIIQHGMYVCTAKKPKCEKCIISNYCNSKNINIDTTK